MVTSNMREDQRKRLKKVITATIILVVIGFIYVAVLIHTDLIIKCPLRELTGFLCPGCGVTHMCLAILRGDINTAFLSNRVLFIMLPLVILVVTVTIYEYVSGHKLSVKKKKVFDGLCFFMIIVLLVWGITRNIFGI